VTKDKKAVDFEQQLESLEALVESLESGDLSLARECQQALKTAEQKVELLMRQGDELISQPFDASDS